MDVSECDKTHSLLTESHQGAGHLPDSVCPRVWPALGPGDWLFWLALQDWWPLLAPVKNGEQEEKGFI
jgi:hypothetical protein